MKSVIVTKKSVIHVQGGLFNITLNMQYLDGETVLIDTNISEHYVIGENRNAILEKFKAQMQKAIDNYKAAQVIFDSAAIDTAVTNIQNNLEA